MQLRQRYLSQLRSALRMTNECTSPLEVVCYVLGTESPESTNPAGLTPTEVAAAASAASQDGRGAD